MALRCLGLQKESVKAFRHFTSYSEGSKVLIAPAEKAKIHMYFDFPEELKPDKLIVEEFGIFKLPLLK